MNEAKLKLYARQVLLDVLRHPLDFARVLVQAGHEPQPAQRARSLLGAPCALYPNLFAYVGHIYARHGLLACYSGVWLKTTGNLTGALVTDAVAEQLGVRADQLAECGDEEATSGAGARFLSHLRLEMAVCTVAVLVTEPFHLLTVRRMCQLVGGETQYDTLLGAILEVYYLNGWMGFYAGVAPRWIGEALTLILTNSVTFAINYGLCAWGRGETVRRHTKSAVSVVAASVMYPFKVVGKCMSVLESGLVVGNVMKMKGYTSWLGCWVDLSKRKQLKRGASLFFRYASDVDS